jgi:hypothetical protein
MRGKGGQGKRGGLRRLGGVVALALALPALAGCYEDSSLKTHSPGVYQGKPDSRAIMSPNEAERAALRVRFKQTQTDR